MYLNNNIVKNGNIFLFSDFDNAGLIFNFARLNNFENHVFRLRDCLFENMTTGELKDFVDENNIYFIVSSPEGTSYPHLREWVNNSFERVGIKGNLLIHKSYKRSFEHIERVCQYNCKIRMEICSNFTLD